MPESDSSTYGVKYDYESVMHYAKDAFASSPGKITMETLHRDFQVQLKVFCINFLLNNENLLPGSDWTCERCKS